VYSLTRIPLTRSTSAVAEMIVLFGESRVADVMFSQRYTAILSPTQDEHAIAMFSVYTNWTASNYKKLRYRRVTARCVLSVVILPITTQQCRNYLYDKFCPNRWYEVGGLVGGNVS